MCQRIPLAAAAMFWAVAALAFANAPIGSVIENVSMPSLKGPKENLLGGTNVSVFLFIKPGLEHSHTTLVQIAQCEKELAGKPVHWAAVVSDRIPKAEVEKEVAETGLAMPVLIDEGDALYGKLGVILHPVVGITDKDHKILAYQPFTKVNYSAVVRAQICHALKEITDQELQDVLKPPPITMGGDESVAHRYFKLAEKQFGAKNYEQALANVKKALEKDTTLAAVHALHGRILAAQGNRAEAQSAFEAALKLDPKNATALEGIKALR